MITADIENPENGLVMSRIIPTGEQNFATLREENLFYIDKTRFIQEWWEGRDRVTLITRPRRFG
ncbi:MAG: AAA family ATPase, partial [Desulfovibrio sp.]|nr:AAA family ATPase [Desulfovibrio sp.]